MRVLIVDDHKELRSSMRRMLKRLPEVETVEADSYPSALSALAEPVDLLVLDIRLSDNRDERGGLDLLRELRRTGRDVPAVMVTSSSALEDLREAMRLGARDYVLKDEFSEELFLPIVRSFSERLSLRGEVQRLREKVEDDWGLAAILGSSPAMERVRKAIARVADFDAPVLLLGETGTGKELVARAIHQTSARRDAPFVAVNCSAVPNSLLESLLFGYEKGAFHAADRARRGRLSAAGEGTLLLDEIADLPLDVQGKLLRVLEEGKFFPVGANEEEPLRARVLAATNADLAARVQRGLFRSDLFYRLEVVSLRLPTLAERGPGDVAELLVAFAEAQPRKVSFTKRAVDWLVRRPWPGNVRELRNVVQRVSIMAERDEVDLPELVELVPDRLDGASPAEIDAHVDALLSLPDAGIPRFRAIERAVFRRAIERSNGNKSAAARMLGLPRTVMLRRWSRLSSNAELTDDDLDED